jgi:hypothetical protein
MALYKLQMFFLDILDRLTFRRCNHCDEIMLDDECDYCG